MKCKTLFQMLVLSFLLFSNAFALGKGDSHFYDVKDLKIWASGGVDYRKFDVQGINDLIFNNMGLADTVTVSSRQIKDGDTTIVKNSFLFGVDAHAPRAYKRFGEELPMGFIEFGADYKRFSMGFRLAGMQSNISSIPSTTFATDSIRRISYGGGVEGTHFIGRNRFGELVESLSISDVLGTRRVITAKLQDAKMFNFHLDFNFGFMLFPETSPFNIIPRVGLGYSFLDVVFPGTYSLYYENSDEPRTAPFRISSQNYTSFGKSISPELEVRLRLFGGLHAAVNAGWRVTRYDAIVLAEEDDVTYFVGSHDNRADSYYGGAKLVYVFKSERERERGD